MKIEQVEYDQLKEKADKWDALGDEIAKCYSEPGDEDYDEGRDEMGLIAIGEAAASAYGWL